MTTGPLRDQITDTRQRIERGTPISDSPFDLKADSMLISLIVAGVVLVLLAVGFGFWWMMQQPLYRPGMVRAAKNLREPLDPPQQPDNATTWQVSTDVELHRFSVGTGRPVLILHGGPGIPHREPWPGLQTLTDRYSFHDYDQRGCGRSTRPIDRFDSGSFFSKVTELERTLGLGAQVADVERIRRILGQDRLTLIGHSFGGLSAALYASEFPERVERMILIAPADLLVTQPVGGGIFERVRERLPEAMREEYRAFLDEYFDFGTIFKKSEADLSQLHGGFARFYWAAVDGQPEGASPEPGEIGGWAVWAQFLSMGRRRDYRAALGACRAPVLVLHGTEDLQPESASRRYADAFPDGRFETIPKAAHFPFQETPDAFARAVSGFLD